MQNLLEKINSLSEKRVDYLAKYDDKDFYKWSETYFEQIPLELQETLEEYRENNSVYLEDELWDVLWDYFCLLYSLKQEWKITSITKVLQRCYKKYSERINEKTWKNNWIWNEVKKIQKEELKKEHNLIYKVK